ncbi:uncharacterized protein F4807DRAFT_447666 [Annulohypoxylon truncatum]|uniref:uncharacterized protein n=1 Tax=Annulohypoxylon truncatum TaxID=327061 RepID=UPI00200750FD|nr:uncharacterized protein F4807DRAFT_447666 [Annulohypoxylon truncatum]KAI1204319.1 hypothetical protein F4807DRAFT_447666 [Annulohypoxylon truncatum]
MDFFDSRTLYPPSISSPSIRGGSIQNMDGSSEKSGSKGGQNGGGSSKLAHKMHASLHNQISLLRRLPENDDLDEIMTAPLFTYPVLRNAASLATDASKTPFAQYALLAGDADIMRDVPKADPHIFYNVTTPSSMFICGSQGSGKSHSLSCMLENCLLPAPLLGNLPKPLTGIVFHYDTFISDSGGIPCEAAYLSTDPRVKVRVLCPPTNVTTIKDTYSCLKNVRVEELRLKESYLNTKRMLELMAFGDGHQPLYMHVIQRILRDMRIAQQQTRSGFKYNDFVRALQDEKLMPDQMRPLQQRLDTLESFMVPEQIGPGAQMFPANSKAQKRANKKATSGGTNWTPQSGELIIVDLSCPCITPSMACSLFNICLAIFLEQKTPLGRVIALDEAHKYMGETVECETLTNNLLSVIRLQRHLGARVIISTQEPTISPKLLDLCSITVVHRFTSPDWLKMLTKHLAGISMASKMERRGEDGNQDAGWGIGTDSASGLHDLVASSSDPIIELFSHIVRLKTGEALVFAPGAMIDFEKQNSQTEKIKSTRLAHRIMRVVIRARITMDGGRSIMAT